MKRSARTRSSTESRRRHASAAPGASIVSISPTNSSILSSAINQAHGVRRRPNPPVLTEESIQQEPTERTVVIGPPGRILVDLQAGLRAQACARPQLAGERP